MRLFGSAREFAGHPMHDDRIMSDGRPAHAWQCELEMLREREPELQRREKELMDRFSVLRIAEWAYQRDILQPWDTLLVLRIKPPAITTKGDPLRELLEHPEKYISVEHPKAKP